MNHQNTVSAASAPLWAKGAPSPYELHDLTHFPDWRNLIVWDAFFNNLTSGLMIVTCLFWACGPAIFSALLPFALTLALVLVCIDLVLLICDLGDSWRFSHALRVMRFTSPLSVGVWGLACYATFLGVAVALYWLGALSSGTLAAGLLFVARPFAVLALMGAVVVICYKGVVFSCSSQPGVRDGRWLTSFMVSDALLMGLGAYMLLAACLGAKQAAPWLIMPLCILVTARCVAFGLLWTDVKERARRRYSRGCNGGVAFCLLVAGGALPILLAFFGAQAQAVAGVLLLACGALARYWLIYLTHRL